MQAPAHKRRRVAGQSFNFDLAHFTYPRAYVRVSTDDQAEEGTSIQDQVERLKAFCRSQGVTLRDEDIFIDDGYSGKDLNRPAMQKLRELARQGLVDCVLVTKVDRLSRNLRDTVNLVLGEWQDDAPPGREVMLKSITEPFDTVTEFGKLVFALLAMFAEFERRRITERTIAGRRARAAEGLSPGFPAPYGFTTVPLQEGRGKRFEPVPFEQEVARNIVRMYLGGLGDAAIAEALRQLGITYRGGKPWGRHHVTRLLKNYAMIGQVVFGKESRKDGVWLGKNPEEEWARSAVGAFPAVISEEEFRQIQALRRKRVRLGARTVSSPHLLSGILRCRCGSAMTASRKRPYVYYVCCRKMDQGRRSCSQHYVRLDRLEEQVLRIVAAALASDHQENPAAAAREQQIRLCREQISAHEKELDTVQGARRRYMESFEAGHLPPQLLGDRLQELEQQKRDMEQKIQDLQQRIRDLQDQKAEDDLVLDAVDRIRTAWNEMAQGERKQALARLIRQVRVDGDEVYIDFLIQPPVQIRIV